MHQYGVFVSHSPVIVLGSPVSITYNLCCVSQTYLPLALVFEHVRISLLNWCFKSLAHS